MKGQWILASVLFSLLILVVGASQAQGPEPSEAAWGSGLIWVLVQPR